MKKVLISTTTFGEYDAGPLKLLEKSGYSYSMNPCSRKLSPDETVGLAKGAVGIIAGTEALNRAVLEKLPGLKAISRCGVGLDNVDLAAAGELGIKVTIADSGIAEAVSELVLGLSLAMARNICVMDRRIRSKKWGKIMGTLLEDKMVGIIGLGRIGREVAKKFIINGARVVYYDPYIKRADVRGVKGVNLKSLLRSSDIVSLHLSYSGRSKGFIGKRELSLMKRSAFLINCSRGGIVDEKALYAALKQRRIAAAAIDVFEDEPYSGALTELDNVILTPHIGSYAKESRIGMEAQAVRNLIRALRDKR